MLYGYKEIDTPDYEFWSDWEYREIDILVLT